MNLHSIITVKPIIYWRDSSGRRHTPQDMSDTYIRNILRRFGHTPRTIQFVGRERAVMLSAVVAEATKRGIMSQLGDE